MHSTVRRGWVGGAAAPLQCTRSLMHLALDSSLHVVLALLLVKLTLFLSCGILVLLVLGNKIVHVALCFCELHLVHPLSGVPMQESLAAKHGCKRILPLS